MILIRLIVEKFLAVLLGNNQCERENSDSKQDD